MAAPDDGEEWRFSLEDLEDGEDGRADETGGDAERVDAEQAVEEEGGSIAGEFRPDKAVEPGEIDPENAFFVLVGVLTAGLFLGAILMVVL